MKQTTTQLIMLGTGEAVATRCYNTCFVVSSGADRLLVDAGGGNGVLVQLRRAGIALCHLHHLFLTHAHTDHVLGAVWVVRMIAHRVRDGQYEGRLTVYGHDRVLSVLDAICRLTLGRVYTDGLGSSLCLRTVVDGERWSVGGMALQCFDIRSPKEKQYGLRVGLPDGQTLVCLGDEPYNEVNRDYAWGADWLMHEAFCLYAHRDVFRPYEKRHSTALEAGLCAERLGVRNLLLYHTEDEHLAHRRALYTAEAAQHFKGRIVVPDDLEVIDL